MKNYKMICLDIDGTLLDSHHRISKKNKNAIALANNDGISVVLVSSRLPDGIYSYHEELGITSPIISFGGR